jgi:hypothetical protein
MSHFTRDKVSASPTQSCGGSVVGAGAGTGTNAGRESTVVRGREVWVQSLRSSSETVVAVSED